MVVGMLFKVLWINPSFQILTCAFSSVSFRGRLNALSANSGTVSKCLVTSNLFPSVGRDRPLDR